MELWEPIRTCKIIIKGGTLKQNAERPKWTIFTKLCPDSYAQQHADRPPQIRLQVTVQAGNAGTWHMDTLCLFDIRNQVHALLSDGRRPMRFGMNRGIPRFRSRIELNCTPTARIPDDGGHSSPNY